MSTSYSHFPSCFTLSMKTAIVHSGEQCSVLWWKTTVSEFLLPSFPSRSRRFCPGDIWLWCESITRHLSQTAIAQCTIALTPSLLSPLSPLSPLQLGMTSSKMAPKKGGREAFHRRRSEYFNSNLEAAGGMV